MKSHSNIICIIPARGGSKAIPDKNIADLGGRPLISWTIEAAKLSGAVARIIVSTDSEAIAALAREAGAEAPFLRPANLAEDHVHSVHVVLHALDWLVENENTVPDGIMMLLPTSPFRRPADISSVVDIFHKQDAKSVISITDTRKYMTNLRFMRQGCLIPADRDENPNAQRQELEKIYAVNGSIYLAQPDALRAAGTFHMTGAAGYVMEQINSLDINEPEDLGYAQDLLKRLDPWQTDPEAA